MHMESALTRTFTPQERLAQLKTTEALYNTGLYTSALLMTGIHLSTVRRDEKWFLSRALARYARCLTRLEEHKRSIEYYSQSLDLYDSLLPTVLQGPNPMSDSGRSTPVGSVNSKITDTQTSATSQPHRTMEASGVVGKTSELENATIVSEEELARAQSKARLRQFVSSTWGLSPKSTMGTSSKVRSRSNATNDTESRPSIPAVVPQSTTMKRRLESRAGSPSAELQNINGDLTRPENMSKEHKEKMLRTGSTPSETTKENSQKMNQLYQLDLMGRSIEFDIDHARSCFEAKEYTKAKDIIDKIPENKRTVDVYILLTKLSRHKLNNILTEKSYWECIAEMQPLAIEAYVHLLRFQSHLPTLLNMIPSGSPEKRWMALYLQGTDNFFRMKYQAALSDFTTLSERYPDNIDIKLLMAHCYKRMGKTIRAAFLYRQVRMLDSCFVKDMYHYGVCLKQLSKIANLNKLARDLRDCNDKHPDTWCVMALLWDVEQEKDKALQMVHKALELQPDHYGALQLRGQLLMETKPNESLKSFRDANRIEKDIISYEGLVNAYILLGRQLEAVGTAKEVMELMSDSAHALAIYGIAIYHSGEERVDEALEVLQKAISMDAGCIQAALCLVTIYEKLERYDEAIQILDQQIDYQPPDAIHVRKAEIYTTMEQWEKAFLSYQSAISANFDNVRAKEGMARVEKILTGGDDEDDDGVEGSDNNDELEGDGIDTDLDHDQDLMAGNLDEDEVLTGEEDQGEDFEEGYSFRQQEQQQQPSAPQQLDASLLQMAESFRTRQLQQQQQQRQSNAVTPVRPLAQNSYEHTGPPPLIRRPRQQQLQQFTQHASQHQQQQQQHASSSSTFGFRVDSPHTPPRMTSPVSPSSRTPPGAPVMSRPYQSIHRLPLDRDSPEPDMEE